MTWRGSTTVKDRILACLPYLVPLLEVLMLGSFLFALIPPLGLLFSPLFPLLPIYFFSIGGIALVEFGVFFGLFLGVVQNHTLPLFIRFNTIQALLLGVFAVLCRAALDLLGISQQVLIGGFSGGMLGSSALLVAVALSAIFIVVVAASVYSVVQSLRGQYAEIPLISEAAHAQVR